MKKINTKRILAGLLSLLMVLTIPAPASATIIKTGICGTNVNYRIDNNNSTRYTLLIYGEGAMRDYGSTGVYWNTYLNVKDVEISSGVTRIGDNAFRDARVITISIPDTVTSIGKYAFYADTEDTPMTSITIPDSVETIGMGAFRDCADLKRVRLPQYLTRIENSLFEGCGIESINLPDTVTSIGSGAFRASGLKSLEIPEYVTEIESEVFRETPLESFTFPGYVSSISEGMFYGCRNLKNVTIEEGISDIGDSAFEKCVALTELVIPEGVTSIGDRAFADCSNILSITIPDSVEHIGSEAFKDCTKLVQLKLPENLKSIGSNAFSGCDSLNALTIPDGMTKIGAEAFRNCDFLTSITIPSSVTEIGGAAFYDCDKLTEITIPDSVKTMGKNVFYSCDGLESAFIGDIGTIGQGIFSNCTKLTQVQINGNIQSIGQSAFSECDSLLEITIPKGVTEIANNAFYSCDRLTHVTISDTVTQIGTEAFSECISLGNIVFTGDAPLFGDNAFYNVIAVATYPKGNDTWTPAKCRNYGGLLTWEVEKTEDDENGGNNGGSEAGGNSGNSGGSEVGGSGENNGGSEVGGSGENNGGSEAGGNGENNGGNGGETEEANESLKIILEPKTQTVQNGETVFVVIGATGLGLNYQWFYKDYAMEDFEASDVRSNIYSFTMTPEKNGRQLYCMVVDRNGNIVKSKTVTIAMLSTDGYAGGTVDEGKVEEVKVDKLPSKQWAKSGKKTTIAVFATGENLAYQWQYRTSSKGKWKNCNFSSAKTDTLRFKVNLKNNGYYYRCIVKGSTGDAVYSSAVRLYVTGIKSQPKPRSVKSGKKVIFKVTATGDGLTYKWQYRSPSQKKWKKVSAAGSNTNKVKITATASCNGNKYRCVIKDKAGDVVYSKAAKLKVK